MSQGRKTRKPRSFFPFLQFPFLFPFHITVLYGIVGQYCHTEITGERSFWETFAAEKVEVGKLVFKCRFVT